MSYFRVYKPFRTQFIQINVPISLTIMRMLLIPILVLVYTLLATEWKYLISGAIFTLACVTDWLDGYLARKLGQISSFGAFLDPVADKLIVAVALILLINTSHIPNLLLPAIIIIGREITVSSLREVMSELGKRTSIMVNWLGKLKTLLQMFALGTLLAVSPSTHKFFLCLGYVLIYAAAFLTIISMFVYMRLALTELSDLEDTNK